MDESVLIMVNKREINLLLEWYEYVWCAAGESSEDTELFSKIKKEATKFKACKEV